MLSEDQQMDMASALLRELRSGAKTFGALWPAANACVGADRMDHNAAGYRFTDRWLQRQRKLGYAEFARDGKYTRWSLTKLGVRVHFDCAP